MWDASLKTWISFYILQKLAIFWTNQPIDIWGSGNAIIYTIGKFPVQTSPQVIQYYLIAISISKYWFLLSKTEIWKLISRILAHVNLGEKL